MLRKHKKQPKRRQSTGSGSGRVIASLASVGFVFLFLILGILASQPENKRSNSTTQQHVISAIEVLGKDNSEFAQLLKPAIEFYRNKELTQALEAFDAASDWLQHASVLPDPNVLYIYYTQKAEVHWLLWQVVEAQQAWLQSQKYTHDKPQLNYINKNLAQAKEVMQKLNTERNQKTFYQASPHQGPSRYLGGHVAVAFFYIEDRDSAGWGIKQRQISEQAFENVQQWYISKSAEYQQTVTFSLRKFIIQRDPYLKRVKLKYDKSANGVRQVISRTIKNIGARDVADFVARIKAEEAADQVAMVFLINRKHRSFALRCLSRCVSDGEFAFILNDAKSKNANEFEYTQAHEILHLFGADDLYNIANATYYAPRDIMHYNSKFLDATSLTPITAYAVGLSDSAPAAPFDIKTY